MKQIDEIVRSFEQCNNCGGCKGCAYEDEESCADNLEEDVLEILRKVQGGKRMKITITTPEIKDLEKRLAEEKDRAEAWDLRCGELEQELRDAQGQLDESVRKEAQLGLWANKLRDKVWEQNWVIAQYDDENMELKKNLGSELVKVQAERDEYRQDRNKLMDENTELKKQLNDIWERYRSEQSARMKAQSERDEAFEMDGLNYWAKRIHRIAVDHGWWESEESKCDDGDRPFPEIVALCHSELSEALEEYRNGKPMAYIDPGFPHEYVEDPKIWPDNDKPEGIAVEMLDCVIRILDWMGHEGVDVDTLMEKKVKYNEGREHRHGGKTA